MASKKDEKEKPDEAGDSPSKQKRPAQTIDLEAEEVEVKINKADEAGKGESKDTAPADAQADSAGADQKQGGKPDKRKRATAGKKPPPPPQRTKPSDVRRFVTHLAAGLVGGLVGVVGAGVGLDKLVIPGLTTSGAPAQDVARMKQRLDELSAKLEAKPAAAPDLASTEKLESLEKRLVAIETKPAPELPAIPEDLTTRLAGLEETLKSLQAAGADSSSGGLEQSAALIARIGKIEQATRDRLSTLETDLSAARTAIETAVKDSKNAADSGALTAMTDRIARLEKSIADLAAQPTADDTAPADKTGAAALAYESLRRAAQAGEPFKAQLELLEKLGTPRDVLKPLAVSAAQGVPTQASLLAQWPVVLRKAEAAGKKAGDTTFLDRLASNASTVVRIRRVEPAGSVGTESHEGLAGAIEQAEALDGAAAKAVAPWLEKARARVALDAALADLESALLTDIGGPPPDKG